MRKITFILMLIAEFSLLEFSAFAETKTIVKWKDSNGLTHYGDKLPSQEAGRNNTELRNNGIVIKQNMTSEKKNAVDQQKEQEKLAQQRADKVLLASYTNADEIDLARERNLQTDHAALQSLIQHKNNVLSRNEYNKKIAQGFKQKNKALPAGLITELKQSQSQIDSTNKQISLRKQNMETTRKRYEEEKNRFIVLKQANLNVNEPAMSSLNMR